MLFLQPLEQFEVSLGGISNASLGLYVLLDVGLHYYVFVLSLLSLLYALVKSENRFFVGDGWVFFRRSFLFVVGVFREQVGDGSGRWVGFFFGIFVLILFLNVSGLFPFGYTVTSNLYLDFGLSFAVFWGVTIRGFWERGYEFLSIFLAENVPIWLEVLLVVIEVFTYCFRGLSLAIRLFANMVAGHALLKILLSFLGIFREATELWIGGFGYFVGVFFVIGILGLEIGVAFLQAYVFLVLISIYLKDTVVFWAEVSDRRPVELFC